MSAGEKYRDELIATANAIASAGKGILAADESTGTIGKRFKDIDVENNEENRIRYRGLLFNTPGLEKHISGVILFDETLRAKDSSGNLLVKPLVDAGIKLGIKVDKGVAPIPGTDGETSTQGLDGLAERCKEYYSLGCRFAKWRAVYKISDNAPSAPCILENAWALARYGAICQDNGLVPIIEPEILMDGDHNIERTAEVTELVQTAVYKAIRDQNLLLEGTLLKPNMVCPGSTCKDKAKAMDIAAYTVRTLQRTVPVAVPGIVFLSGGQSEEEATQNLNAMNAMPAKKPWALTFSYGRALQQSCLKAWKGDTANESAAQAVFLERAKANGDAQLGKYEGGSKGDTSSLFVSNYSY
eukprot:CAMPEP_0181310752 /NCGR_PEP_ID=MMETSP1101-20121128/12760_1 /TAXON_ID=46948 /ORGANISM="Rhodomonas abbreviata, Strain Caron Lab Isolate" /LENGTH=355 /DNA_ID=CAMNT_0023417415 /DNA_START=8 /DNA_END=1075 /DNA_ORIENTATION=-